MGIQSEEPECGHRVLHDTHDVLILERNGGDISSTLESSEWVPGGSITI